MENNNFYVSKYLGWLGFILILLSAGAFGDVQTIQIEPQQNFSVTLESNRMTGYHWELSKPLDPRYLVFITKKYYKPAYKMSREMGHEKWDFKALAAGETVIALKYLQPWEQDSTPFRTQEIKIKIAKQVLKKAPGKAGSEDELAPLKERTQVVIQALMAGDYLTLAQYVHPAKGVRFSPYAAYVSSQDMFFSAQEVRRFSTDKRQYIWGKYYGSDLPIDLTAVKYFKDFVQDRNFAQASNIKYFRIANSAKGLGRFFKGGIAVDFNLSGSSLKLVFEKEDGQYFLTGVLSNGQKI